LLGVDDEKSIGRINRASVGITADADPSVHALGDGQQLRLKGIRHVLQAYTTLQGSNQE
jgi:hypothetical protein